MTYQIETQRLPSRPTLTIRRRARATEISATLGEIFPAVARYLAAARVPFDGAPFTIFHRVTPDEIEIEAGMALARPVPGTGEIVAGELPAGEAAVTWHVGPYDRLPEAVEALKGWLGRAGRQPAGPYREVYWTDPVAEPDPGSWRTELILPLASAPSDSRSSSRA